MKVSVFGLGDLGCVTAACLARAGHHVVAVDADRDTVDLISAGRAPIAEPGLDSVLTEVVEQGLLQATTDVRAAVAATDIGLICVDTHRPSNGQPPVDVVERVGREIGHAVEEEELDRTFTVLLRSTVLPGTTENVLAPALNGACLSGRIKLAANPAFLRHGSALRDFEQPPLVLVGCSDMSTASLVRDLYREIPAPFVETSVRNAELVRHASAAFNSMKVCFANEIGDLSNALGADGQEVMRILSMDYRQNLSECYLKPGFAFGGTVLPQGVQALMSVAKTQGVAVPLLAAIAPSNDSQISAAVDAVIRSGKHRIGVVGLPFKFAGEPITENPVAILIERLMGRGRHVAVLDRTLNQARRRDADRAQIDSEIPHIVPLLCDDVQDFVDDIEVLVIGRATKDAAQALSLVGFDCTVIDLTRGVVYDAQRNDDAQLERVGVGRPQ